MKLVKIWSTGVAHHPECGHVAGNQHLLEAADEDRVAGCCLHRLTTPKVGDLTRWNFQNIKLPTASQVRRYVEGRDD